MRFHLLRYEILLSYLDLFFFRISGDLYHFHPVKQRSRDGLGGIGRGYEHDFREIERNFQEMIGKFLILFRIEHLQQCGRRISLKIRAYLIHFIEQEHRVIGSRVLDSVYNSARYSSYICSAVTPYLGLVANSAKGHSYEFPSRSSGYGLGYRGLAYSRRSYKTDYRALYRF